MIWDGMAGMNLAFESQFLEAGDAAKKKIYNRQSKCQDETVTGNSGTT